MNKRELLADLLIEFAHTLGEGYEIQQILDHLVVRIVDVLPVTGAGVMLMDSAGDLHFAAASNDAILAIETLQNELGEGPCLEAYQSGDSVAIPDLNIDERFPRFSGRAKEAGLAAVFTFPMSSGGNRLGALDLYRNESGALSDSDIEAAQVLSDVAAAYVHNARGQAAAAETLDLLRQRSLHDPLTGLPNRTLLKERLEQAVARATRTHQAVAVLFVDIDRFKSVNDRYGHQVGDQLLTAVAGRLKRILRAGDTLARLSGDEFVIVCEGLEKAELAERVAERVIAALLPPIELGSNSLHVTASVGLAFSGPGDEIPESLLRDADFAMYQAKRCGGARHTVLSPEARLAVDRRGVLAREIRDALARDEFRLAYQPLVDVKDGRVVAVEALLRWQHPTRGLVMPNEILPVAEPTGLILALGEWVLTQACRDLQRWRQCYGLAIPHVTVNVSPYQVIAPGFDTTVQQVLESTAINPADVLLEVTESAFLEDGPRAFSVLKQTKDLGVGLILDDFGTGYSSLNYVRQFPFDILKIDRVFTGSIETDHSTRTIVSAIINMAHGLELSVVAEGVETQEQLHAVERLGTDRAQGYHLCRPLLAEQLEQRILEPAGSSPIRLPLATPHTSSNGTPGLPTPRTYL